MTRTVSECRKNAPVSWGKPFLPLFSNNIPGFSDEKHTAASGRRRGNPDRDPWIWREMPASGRQGIVYGNYFFGNAGFTAGKWFADSANVRRDGYDSDALWNAKKTA